MKFILEGCDNSGKTTLAKHVTEKSGALYHHPGGRPRDFTHELECTNMQIGMVQSGRPVVIDRVTPISQQVYTSDSMFDQIRMDTVRLMRESGAVIIYCRPSTDKLMRTADFTWREGESEEFKQEIINNAHRFIERYDAVMQQIPCVSYDFENQVNAQLIRNQMVAALRGDEPAKQWFLDLLNYRKQL